MKATTRFLDIDEYPIEITLTGRLSEFKSLVDHIGQGWTEPMLTFIKEINNQVDIADKQINKQFYLPLSGPQPNSP